MKSDISVLIYARNEVNQIEEAIRSAQLLSPTVVVVDIDSGDATRKKALALETDILDVSFSSYVESLREKTIEQLSSKWIFILDADERLTQELAKEIKKTLEKNQFTSYQLPRKNIFGRKKWLKHGGWWPDYQTRLIKREAFVSWPKHIHSTPMIKGQQGTLSEPFLHYFHGDLEGMVTKTTVFENIEADLLYKAKKPVSTATFFRKFFGELYRRSIKNLGFLDGEIGIIECIYQAFSKTITYLYLYEQKISRTL